MTLMTTLLQSGPTMCECHGPLPAGGTLGATPDSISKSGSVVRVTGLLAGGPVEDLGLVWPNKTVSEATD